MTDYVMRVTIVVPSAMRDDANDLAMVLTSLPEDAGTFGAPLWEDVLGGLYSIASTPAKADFPSDAASTLQRPAWDVEPYIVNMAGARRAQAALVVCTTEQMASLQEGKIIAIIGDDPLPALTTLGLSRIEE